MIASGGVPKDVKKAILALHYDRLLPRKWLKIGKNS
jgi:hypothetical protein